MTKKELVLEVIRRLKAEYPDSECSLDYDDAWKLLVSVRLAAQCTDARVNVVVKGLYEKYPDIASLAAASPEEIEKIIRPCGLGKSKARAGRYPFVSSFTRYPSSLIFVTNRSRSGSSVGSPPVTQTPSSTPRRFSSTAKISSSGITGSHSGCCTRFPFWQNGQRKLHPPENNVHATLPG